MITRKLLVFNILLFIAQLNLHAEITIDDVSFHDNSKDSINTFYGLRLRQMQIVPHADNLRIFSGTRPRSFQFEFAKMNLSKQSWQQCNCLNNTGFLLGYTDFGNRMQLGQAYEFALFTEPYLAISEKSWSSIRAGAGISYLNRTYHEETNPFNLFYSSSISFNVQLGYAFNYKLNNDWQLQAAVMMNHISNGGMKRPNKGINYPGLDLSIRYTPNQKELPSFEKLNRADRKLKYWVQTLGFVQTGAYDHGLNIKRRPGYGINLAVLKPLGLISQLGLGTELVYDGVFKSYDEVLDEYHFDPFIFSLNLQHNIVLGKMLFAQQFGYYIHRQHAFQDYKYFQRYSLHFKTWERVYPGVTLKTHAHMAEYLALSLAFLLN